jgi:anti-sigma regulatory factor (Ser/Thr protein kinase)
VLRIVDPLSITLPADASSATTARTEVTRRLAPRLTSGALEDVRLLLTELITNSLRHADLRPEDEIGVRAELVDGTVRIEVTDPGNDGPVEVRPPGARGGGYGLFLVDRLTSRWGVDRDGGTTVWAELSAGPAR